MNILCLVKVGKSVHWKTISEMPDARDMIVFNTKKEVMSCVKQVIKAKQYPEKVNVIEVSQIIPAYIDNAYWYEHVSYITIMLDKDTK